MLEKDWEIFVTRAKKTQTLGLLLVWVKLKKSQKTQTQKTQLCHHLYFGTVILCASHS